MPMVLLLAIGSFSLEMEVMHLEDLKEEEVSDRVHTQNRGHKQDVIAEQIIKPF
jgi:hypothetical protein